MALNIATLAPVPKAMDRTAMAVKPGFLISLPPAR
jgi:hypothetical protein